MLSLERSVPVSKEIREKIPVISFLMMIEVMLYHCESPDNALAVNAADLWLNNFLTAIVTHRLSVLCMSWFFAITGFLLFRNLSFQNLGAKLKTRVQTLLIPYILWQIIYILKSIFQGNHWTLSEMFAQTFLLRIWPPLGAFWYVYAVFLLALLSPLFLPLFRNERIGWISTIFLIILLYVFWSHIWIGNGKSHYTGNIKAFFPSYLIGAFYGSIYEEAGNRKKLRYLAYFLLIGVLFDGNISDFFVNVTIAVLPMLMLFLLPVPEWAKNRKLYRFSFLIYATHQSLISISIGRIRSLLYLLVPSAAFSNFFGRLLCILFIIAVNYGIYSVMHRFAPKTLGILTGGRS